MMDQQYCDALKELEEVKAERDALQRLSDCRREQRDALAAHVEAVRSAYGREIAGLTGNDERSARLVAVGRALNQSPVTSLAHLKAEAVKALRDDYCIKSQLGKRPSLYVLLDEHLEELRRQAEEPSE